MCDFQFERGCGGTNYAYSADPTNAAGGGGVAPNGIRVERSATGCPHPHTALSIDPLHSEEQRAPRATDCATNGQNYLRSTPMALDYGPGKNKKARPARGARFFGARLS
jgi:hypothetical protein